MGRDLVGMGLVGRDRRREERGGSWGRRRVVVVEVGSWVRRREEVVAAGSLVHHREEEVEAGSLLRRMEVVEEAVAGKEKVGTQVRSMVVEEDLVDLEDQEDRLASGPYQAGRGSIQGHSCWSPSMEVARGAYTG